MNIGQWKKSKVSCNTSSISMTIFRSFFSPLKTVKNWILKKKEINSRKYYSLPLYGVNVHLVHQEERQHIHALLLYYHHRDSVHLIQNWADLDLSKFEILWYALDYLRFVCLDLRQPQLWQENGLLKDQSSPLKIEILEWAFYT